MQAKSRELTGIIKGQRTTDGDGVKMTRLIGTSELGMLDPFLLFDAFSSEKPEDYIGGFPSHPHRGFETVTYLLAGRMRHKDNRGNEGVIEAGGVQWMTAGRGIVHSETPEQENGLLSGFQLWVNLPAAEKMGDPAYQEFSPEEIPQEQREDGGFIRVIAGTTDLGTPGPIANTHVSPKYMDVSLPQGGLFEQGMDEDDNSFIYLIEGQLEIGTNQRHLKVGEIGILGPGQKVTTRASADSRFLLIAARPLGEPVARGGPFVMNTREEISQTFEDFSNNRF